MKSIFRQFFIKVLSIVIVSIFIGPIIGNTVYAYELQSNSIISFESINKNMIVGQEQSLNAVLLFNDKVISIPKEGVRYESSNSNIIKIENNNAIALSKGKAIIKAYYNNSKTEIVFDVKDSKNLEKKRT